MLDKVYMGDYRKGEIEILTPISIFKNRYIEIFNDQVRFPSGYEGTYIRVNAPCKASVAVLPITSKGKVVVVKTFRHGMRGWGYEVPKGGVEIGESSEFAALRELKEETGYTAGKLHYIGEYSDSPAIFGNRPANKSQGLNWGIKEFFRHRKKGTENQATAAEIFWRWPGISESEVGCSAVKRRDCSDTASRWHSRCAGTCWRRPSCRRDKACLRRASCP